MKRMLLDGQYATLLSEFGLDVPAILQVAALDAQLFEQPTPTLTYAEYFRFMEAIGLQLHDEQKIIALATADQIESFTPPIYAAYCSPNVYVCLQRLAKYKQLIGPIQYQISETAHEIQVEINSADYELPAFLAMTEIVFLVHLIRKATGLMIQPRRVSYPNVSPNSVMPAFLRCEVQKAATVRLVFDRRDSEIAFKSQNPAMWDYFEPELRRRLAELEADSSVRAQVQTLLVELFPIGLCTIDDVAVRMNLSRRTLQRKLQEENTSFQKELNQTRKLLAVNYVENTTISAQEIAFLLAYQEVNSFLRAFHLWTGMSVSKYRHKRIQEINDSITL